MEYSNLPNSYQKLALLRQFESDNMAKDLGLASVTKSRERLNITQNLTGCFNWDCTPEKFKFWSKVQSAQNNDSLPFIPQYSKEEVSKFFLETPKEEPVRQFQVGDIVEIVKSGSGFAPEDIGKITQISEAGLNYGLSISSPNTDGYKITGDFGNGKISPFKGVVGHKSFKYPTEERKKEYLRDKAIEKYPLGTVVDNYNLTFKGQPNRFTINTGNFDSVSIAEQEVEICYEDVRGYRFTVFDGYNWASIVSSSGNIPPIGTTHRTRGHSIKDQMEEETKEVRKQANWITERAEDWAKRQSERMSDSHRYFSTPFGSLAGVPPIYFGTGFSDKISEPEEENGIQPISDKKVKTKKKIKRLIYKHY